MAADDRGRRIPSPTDRNLPADRRALAAGLDALLNHGVDVLADGLHRKRLSRLSGQSRQTLYQHFPDHLEYLDRMIELVLDPHDPAWPTEDAAEYMHRVLAEGDTDAFSTVRRVAANEMQDLRDNEHFQALLVVWALARQRPGLREQLASMWRFYDARKGVALQTLLDAWDSELAEPWDLDRAATLFSAMAEGLAIRAWAMDEVDDDLFADAIAAIAHGIVMPRGVDQRFEPDLPGPDGAPGPPPGPAEVERLTRSVIDHYTRHDRSPTLAELARATGVPESTVVAHFGGLSGLIVIAWNRMAADLAMSFDRLDDHLPAVQRLRAQLGRIIEVARSSPRLTADLLGLATRSMDRRAPGASRRPLTTLAQPIETLLTEARESGALVFNAPAELLSRHIVGVTLGQMVNNPVARDTELADMVTAVWQLTLEGFELAARPLDDAPLDRATAH